MENENISLRRAFLQGFNEVATGSDSEGYPVDLTHECFSAWKKGRRFARTWIQTAAQAYAKEQLEPGVATGANFPHFGHTEVRDGELRICTWRVTLPGDLFQTEGRPEDEVLREFLDYATYDARENYAEDYCMPAAWEAKLVSGEIGQYELVFEVTRSSQS